MPKLNFELPAKVSADHAFGKIQTFLSSENHFSRLDPKLTTTFDQTQKSCHLKGSQFQADIKVSAQAETCTVNVVVEIPLALALFKSKIQQEIEKAFIKILS